MADNQYSTWSDEALAEHAALIAGEQHARQQRAQIPGLVRSLASQYVAGGGDLEALVDAVTTPEDDDTAPAA